MIGSKRKRHQAAIEAAAAGTPPNQAVVENYSGLDRLAIWVTDRIGTMTFFLVIFAWTLAWVGLQHPREQGAVAALAGVRPVPGVRRISADQQRHPDLADATADGGQNMQGRHSEARAEADFLVNQKAFADTEAILKHLEALDARLLELVESNQQILHHLMEGADGAEPPSSPVSSG